MKSDVLHIRRACDIKFRSRDIEKIRTVYRDGTAD